MSPSKQPPVLSRWLLLNDRLLHARVAVGAPPDAPVALLIHGLSISSRYEVPALRALTPHFQALALDLPGFGRSQAPKKPLSIAELAVVVATWLEAMELERVVVAGNSLGGQVAAQLAANHPEKISHLVLNGLTMDPDGRSLKQQVVRALRDIPQEPVSLWPLHVVDFLDAGPRHVWRSFQEAVGFRIEELAPQITVPTLVLRGEHDPMGLASWAEAVAAAIPCGELETIAGAPHAANYAAPAAYAEAIRRFVLENEARD